MTFGSFGAQGSQQSSTTTQDPWSEQIPYLTQGFSEASRLMGMGPYSGPYFAGMNDMQRNAMQQGYGWSDPTQLMEKFYGFGDEAMGGYSNAMNYYRQAMEDPRAFDNPYESNQYQDMIDQNYWTETDQRMADQMKEGIGLNFERSDFGDRSAAGQSGFGGGSKYQISRGLAAGEADRNYRDALASLQGQSLGRATGMADRWASTNLDQQYRDRAAQDQAANAVYGFGRTGLEDITRGWEAGQQGAQAQAGWGDYGRSFDQDQIAAQRQQWMDQWLPLQNYWNIIGGSSWGGTTQQDSSSQSYGGSLGF